MMIFRGASPPFTGDPIPCVPFPSDRGRGGLGRGASPLLDAPLKGRGIKGGFKGGEASLPNTSPSSLKERGTKGVRQMRNGNEKMSELKKRELLNDLNDLKKGLLDYKKRQEKHVRMKFTEGQMRKLDQLRERTRLKSHWLRGTISKYGGSASIKIAGINYDAFEYSIKQRSLYIVPELFTALDIAINTVNTAIREIEAIPIESIDWRDIKVTEHPKEQAKETSSLFDTMQFHPKVVEASESLFKTGNYASAILEAFKAVNNFVKEKSGLSPNELRGIKDRPLMAKVFDEKEPLIKLNELITDTDINEQEGFKLLFMGATEGIRNPKAHDLIKMKDPYKTLEYLAFASLLIKKIDFWEAD